MDDEIIIKMINEGKEIPELSFEQWSRINLSARVGSSAEKMSIKKIGEFARQSRKKIHKSK